MHRALDLDPQSLIVTADIGQLHYFAHEYDQAINYCNRALAMDSSFIMAHVYLRDIYQMNGRDQEFFEELVRTAIPADRIKAQSIFAHAGYKRVLSIELNDPYYLSQKGHMAWLNASLGDKDKTLEYLNRVLQERGTGAFFLPFINVDPLYDFLRDDARFREILLRMNLQPA
jgi:tetratricopeptide (TPR) repeat protein